jgi:hypothetical protein
MLRVLVATILRDERDPAEAKGTEEDRLRKFREARDQIAARITAWLKV